MRSDGFKGGDYGDALAFVEGELGGKGGWWGIGWGIGEEDKGGRVEVGG